MNKVNPEVGMGATYLCGSDRYAGTIIEVMTNKQGQINGFVWQQDKAVRADKNGYSEDQTYHYEPNPDAAKQIITLRKNGRWVEKGQDQKSFAYAVGVKRQYSDPCF